MKANKKEIRNGELGGSGSPAFRYKKQPADCRNKQSPPTGQRLRANELVGVRALFCPEIEKSVPKADEPRNGQRRKDAEGNGEPLH